MIQNVLSGIGGIGIYGVLSISLFFLVFTGTLVRVWFIGKPHLDAMSSLPLEPDDTERQSTNRQDKGKDQD